MASNTMAQSSTERHIGPTLSRLQQTGMTPCRLTRPKVGRKPVMPQVRDGPRIEPVVSVPIEKPTSPAAVAAPGPADEPPEPSSVFHGFFVWMPSQESPRAISPVDSLAISTAPASSRRSTTVASMSMTWSS